MKGNSQPEGTTEYRCHGKREKKTTGLKVKQREEYWRGECIRVGGRIIKAKGTQGSLGNPLVCKLIKKI